ncbi:low-specificity L-threonine aldolase [Micromonospora echinofusca]|uniref:Low-specificity L-threonine aldolase n=1 Tax=Micromonospora echinofusca TaxID=47858 RepID=A0ABS3VIR9_MICEH|nr:low-specificity L-threonine aldolase [Micromonospora echinofusca]MBO4204419.1 low-specificity L-threonine aldolase [Micromonospora echinofusca]
MIELRSDTFTRPTTAMLDAMVRAPLGDDVYGEDPTVNRLEQLAAERLGKEAACLMPSGTMANLAALMAHAPRGAKVIVGVESDIYLYEAAGASVCGGIAYEPVPNEPDGTLSVAAIEAAFPEDMDDPQFALPAVICLENTQNRCGGVVLEQAYQQQVRDLARHRGVTVHLDGARIFNAAVASGRSVADVARYADSVQFCLSKGLSAPIGSVLVGGGEFVAAARRIRKMIGGGMRQAGVVAAAGIVALEDSVDRLSEDHAHARLLAEGLATLPGVTVDLPQTNIVLFRVAGRDPGELVSAAASAGVAVAGFGHGRIRAVTYRGIDESLIFQAVDRLREALVRPCASTA